MRRVTPNGHSSTRTHAPGAVVSAVRSGLVGMLVSKIVGALVPSAQPFNTAERRGRQRDSGQTARASLPRASESNAAPVCR